MDELDKLAFNFRYMVIHLFPKGLEIVEILDNQTLRKWPRSFSCTATSVTPNLLFYTVETVSAVDICGLSDTNFPQIADCEWDTKLKAFELAAPHITADAKLVSNKIQARFNVSL